ncbi:MAG: trehalose-6-phosphate synthase [Thermomicrobium sp.]|nr:trehalose-6-phosphate synthase [Thermomicrobium sp.]MDW7982325.1 trehalose-6-phosphate synthase [Thermomicrobium sp.]
MGSYHRDGRVDAHLPHAVRDLLERSTLVIVSNRGPVEFHHTSDGELVTKRGTGGVITAMSAAARYADAIWVACAMTNADRACAERMRQQGAPFIELPDYPDFRLRFVVPDPEAYHGYYNRIANPLLWFLQHYLWDTPRAPDVDHRTWQAWHDGYVVVNRLFAEEVTAVAAASAREPIILLQDYHLYLAPAFIRERCPDLLLHHFVHIPWPDQDYWRLLPSEMRRAICEGLLANDIVGFQTPRHARSFLNTVDANLSDAEVDYRRWEVSFRGRTTRVGVYPISIDPELVRAVAASEDARRHEEHLQAYRNEFTILRVDRAEPSKNVVRGFLAYDRLLEAHPELIGRVNFLAFLVPTRLEVAEYINYLDEINAVVGRINAKYANAAQVEGIHWQPVHLFVGDDYPRALAAMKFYDVLLVNAIFDGMNLVAKEGALLNERDGVIVLSEGAGAYQQLGQWALTVSPTDIEGTAEALWRGLTMPAAERARRAELLRAHVLEHDLRRWLFDQLHDIAKRRSERQPQRLIAPSS